MAAQRAAIPNDHFIASISCCRTPDNVRPFPPRAPLARAPMSRCERSLHRPRYAEMASPRKPLTLLALILPLAAFVMASPAPAAAPAQGPPGTAFYTPPSPLPSGANGSVIWARDLTGPAALKSAARNALVLYRTTTVE